MRVRFAGLVALMALMLASCGGASPEAGGPSEGIQVHGDWTIDIYNEDGSLDRSVEFENALAIQGAETIVNVLTSTRTPAGWSVRLQEEPNTDDLCPSDGFWGCNERVADPELVDTNNTSFPDTIRLIASTTVEVEGGIYEASSLLEDCPPTTPAADCNVTGGILFTIKDVTVLDWNDDGTPNDGPIPVSAGQEVQVQVDISFTSG